MAIGCAAIAKDIVLAGEIIVKRAGIRSAAVIGRRGKIYIKRTITGAGGVLKGCVVGVAFLAVSYTGITIGVLDVATGIYGGRWRAMAFVTVGW